jgi:hypothetical protein
LHKTIDEKGGAVYHVVDGKQRIETVINFANLNKIRLPKDFGDARLDNKRWKDILGDTDLRNRFLNYVFSVEYFDDVEGALVNEIFARMNKNSRKLTQQELRNARFEGWFAKEVESEVENAIWKDFKISTPGRARRMADAQFIAELLAVIIDDKIVGFDHDYIDQIYADYDEIEDPDFPFDEEAFKETQSATKRRLLAMNQRNKCVEEYASTAAGMYTLWSFLVLNRRQLPSIAVLANKYKKFMGKVEEISAEAKRLGEERIDQEAPNRFSRDAFEYFQNNQSATTELPQRQSRLDALTRALTT